MAAAYNPPHSEFCRIGLMSHMHYDTIISARWIITVENDGEVLENHAIAIKDGRIAQILPVAQCAACKQMKPSHWTTMC
jgi:hypothetical protein